MRRTPSTATIVTNNHQDTGVRTVSSTSPPSSPDSPTTHVPPHTANGVYVNTACAKSNHHGWRSQITRPRGTVYRSGNANRAIATQAPAAPLP